MKRQSDLDIYNPDLQRDRMQDKLMTALCIIEMLLVIAYICRVWQIGQITLGA